MLPWVLLLSAVTNAQPAVVLDMGKDERICEIEVKEWDVNCPKHITPRQDTSTTWTPDT